MPPKDTTPKPSAPKVKPTSGHPKPRSANPNPEQSGGPSKPPAAGTGAVSEKSTPTPVPKNNTPAQAANKHNTPSSAQTANNANTPTPGANKKVESATATHSGSSTGGRIWDLRNFSMYGFDADGKSFEYDSASKEFRFVANCCWLALLSIRRSDTQRALERLGERCVDYWTSEEYRETQPSEWQGDRAKMKEYVKTFTRGIESCPPAIRVEPNMPNCYAAHGRYADYDGNFEVLRTRKCFRFKVPVELVRSIRIALEEQDSHTDYLLALRMVLGLSFWHEFMHGFVSFLAGAIYARTPPSCIPNFLETTVKEEATTRVVGESGDMMECQVWGGAMQMDIAESASEIQRCGAPFFKDNDGYERPIGMKTIKAFLRNPGGYDLKAAVMAVKPRRPRVEPPTAKRQRLDTTFRSEPRNRMVLAWNITFKLDENTLPVGIEKEAVSVAA